MQQFRMAAVAATAIIAAVLAYVTLARVAPPYTIQSLSSDKMYHLIAFACLSFPLAATSRISWKSIFAFATAYGVAIELIQPSFGRNFETADILADIAGVTIGILLGQAIQKLAICASASRKARQ